MLSQGVFTPVPSRVLGPVLQSAVCLFPAKERSGRRPKFVPKSMDPDFRTKRKQLAAELIHVPGIQNILAVLTQAEIIWKLEK